MARSWSIVADDGTRYKPIGLSEELQQHALGVRTVVKLRTDVAGICMAGTIVEIVAIDSYTSG